MRVMPDACPKCGGKSLFYHMSNDPNNGYVKCTACGKRQRGTMSRDEAVTAWNKHSANKDTRKRIWDNFVEVAEVRKSDAIKFVIAAATREGFRYINIREFYLRKADGVWRPGRDGITIPLVAPLKKGESFITPFVDMLDALKLTAAKADIMELMDEEHAVWAEKKIYTKE